MKKIFVLISLLFIYSSCENNDSPIPDNSTEEQTGISLSDICSVWSSEYDDNNFISFFRNGKYYYCFNDHLMGAGTFEIEDNIVILYSAISNKTDKITVELDQGHLIVKGSIYTFNSDIKAGVYMRFDKTDETASPSLVGKEVKPNLYGDGPTYKTIYAGTTFLTETVVKYTTILEHKKTGSQKVVNKTWYYVYRDPLLYTQLIDGDGTIQIYNAGKGQWPGLYML